MPRPSTMPAFALTIFTGAFLLFQVQPLIGKYILPWFGGSPGVWTTCMLFFQMLLLGGYAYAHATSRHLRPRAQAVLHVALLLVALTTLPIIPADHWKPQGAGDPTWRILALLAVSLGLPYLVLAATGPLMQAWFRHTAPGASPYRLYALSNVGSLLALVSYPFYFETNFTRQEQARFWSWGLGVFALGCAYCAYRVWRAPAPVTTEGAGEESDAARPTGAQRAFWVFLPACASILLLAVTNKMCQDVAVIPFLWVLPLALYLLSFIISFDSPRWYSRLPYSVALAVALVAASLALFEGADMPIVRQVVVYSGVLFVGCMVCHGELYRLKPHPSRLTSYYLMISAGGAAGGLFVALVAPYAFDNFHEIHISLALTALLLLAVSIKDKAALTPARWRTLGVILAVMAVYGLGRALEWAASWLRQRGGDSHSWLREAGAWQERFPWTVWVVAGLALAAVAWWRRRSEATDWHRWTCGLMGVGLVALVATLGAQIHESSRDAMLSSRNFYGVQSVIEYRDRDPEWRYLVLQHGRITHGLQFATPERAPMITSYFGPRTGLGLALRHFPRQNGQRIGLIGLGVGTIAAYGKSGDYLRIYEINPDVKAIAEKPFSYLGISKAKIDVVMGDGRLSLENEPPQNFDFLIMDAFSSDAVPVHLLTKEAFAIYQRHLKPDGAILVNISNRYLDLRPVVDNAAREFGYRAHHVNHEANGEEEDDGGWWLYGSTWMILSRNNEFMDLPALRQAASPPAAPNTIPLWTDDYASMFRILQ